MALKLAFIGKKVVFEKVYSPKTQTKNQIPIATNNLIIKHDRKYLLQLYFINIRLNLLSKLQKFKSIKLKYMLAKNEDFLDER